MRDLDLTFLRLFSPVCETMNCRVLMATFEAAPRVVQGEMRAHFRNGTGNSPAWNGHKTLWYREQLGTPRAVVMIGPLRTVANRDDFMKYDMMHVMRNKQANARSVAKEETHDRIVAVAARAIRRSGYDGTGVADIMKEAGLTHGGFYSHFTSREAMLVEAAGKACAESAAAVADVVASAPPGQALAALVRTYLSKEHLAQIEAGCPLAALGSETSRQAADVRRVTTRHIKEMVDLAARQSPDWGQPAAHERALATIATLVGALLLARAVDDPALSDGLREAALKQLLPAAS